MKKAKKITAAVMAAAMMTAAVPSSAGAVSYGYAADLQKAVEECGEGAFILRRNPYSWDTDRADYIVIAKDGNVTRLGEIQPIIYVTFRSGYTAEDVVMPEGTELRYDDFSTYPEAMLEYIDTLRDAGIDIHPGCFPNYKEFSDRKAVIAALKASPAVEEISTIMLLEKYPGNPIRNIAVDTELTAEEFIALYPELGLTVSDTQVDGYAVFDLAEAISPRMNESEKAYDAMYRLAESGMDLMTNAGLEEWTGDELLMTFVMTEVCTPGDANCNGTVDVADAVAVLQYMTNSTKYPLTQQGIINADIDGEEGITGGDVIAIQKLDAMTWDEDI